MRNYYRVYALLFPFFLCFMGCSGSGENTNNDSSSLLCSLLPANISRVILSGKNCSTPLSFGITKLSIHQQDGSIETCSGNLIKEKTILTAAHCLLNADTVNAEINLSETWLSLPFVLHPGFRRDNQLSAFFSDVALIFLPSKSRETPLNMNQSLELKVGDTLRVFGFGKDNSGTVGNLTAGEVTLAEITNNHLVSIYNGKNANPCFGDSGGPALLIRNGSYLVGSVSSGNSQVCGKGDVTRYTNLNADSVRNWIVSNTR